MQPSAVPTITAAVIERAAADAAEAATAAGVRVADVHDVAGFEAVRILFNDVWQPDPGDEAVTRGMLNALVHCGNYCSAAYVGESMVGASMAFLGLLPEPLLHSHITAVRSGQVGVGVGLALKMHQRWWALQRGLGVITWTYDPLIRRNAHFNTQKLGAIPVEYLVDFYGEMNDVINAGQGSDRVVIRWDLRERHRPIDETGPLTDLVGVQDGSPVVLVDPSRLGAQGGRLRVVIPADIEALRIADRALAARWRSTIRDTLGTLMQAGWRVVEVSRASGYLLDPPLPDPAEPSSAAGPPVSPSHSWKGDPR